MIVYSETVRAFEGSCNMSLSPHNSVQHQDVATTLHQHILNQDIQKIDSLLSELSKNTDINLNDLLNKTVFGQSKAPMIVIASELNCFEIVDTLIKYNGDVNVMDVNSKTAIYHACRNNNLKMATLLMSKNANPNVVTTDVKRLTTFMQAANHGNLQMMKLLLNDESKFKYSYDWVCNNFCNFLFVVVCYLHALFMFIFK